MKTLLFLMLLSSLMYSCTNTKEQVTDIVIGGQYFSVDKERVYNGDTITLKVYDETTINGEKKTLDVVYYCDSREIGRSSNPNVNYKFEYVVSGLSNGAHKVSFNGKAKGGGYELSEERVFYVVE